MTISTNQLVLSRLLGCLLPLALAACGGISDTLTGTAATGAPVVGGTVNVKCAGGPALSTTTASAGTWQVAMGGQTLPCKVKVSGGNLAAGQAFHSVAVELGTVNITPVTDLVVATMAERAPGTWFDDDAPAEFQKISKTSVTSALGKVREALPALGALASSNPLTASFKAERGDALDNALEAIKTAIPDYASLLSAAQGAGFKAYAETYASALTSALATLTPPDSSGSGSGGGSAGAFTCKIAAAQLRSPTAQEFALYVKTYSGDVGTGSSYSPASAELKADGQFTVGGKTYTPSSYCFDTEIGAVDYGNTLYLNFPEGKADLWQKNSQHSTSLNAPGTTNLVMSIKINGISAPSVSTTGVPKPANQTEFCASVGSSTSPTSLSNALGAVGSFTINSCTFANNVGTVSATLVITSPISLSTPYSVTYTYE